MTIVVFILFSFLSSPSLLLKIFLPISGRHYDTIQSENQWSFRSISGILAIYFDFTVNKFLVQTTFWKFPFKLLPFLCSLDY